MLKSVVEVFDRRKAHAAIYNEIIGCMRKAMADVCLQHMDADLFVMDEFQRYSELINNKCQSEQRHHRPKDIRTKQGESADAQCHTFQSIYQSI